MLFQCFLSLSQWVKSLFFLRIIQVEREMFEDAEKIRRAQEEEVKQCLVISWCIFFFVFLSNMVIFPTSFSFLEFSKVFELIL